MMDQEAVPITADVLFRSPERTNPRLSHDGSSLAVATPQGFVAHAELEINGGVVMVGNVGPRNAGPRPERVRSAVYVFVEDLVAHFETVRSAGAEILEEPEEQSHGDQTYCAEEVEGHEWYFAQHLRGVSISDLMRGSQ